MVFPKKLIRPPRQWFNNIWYVLEVTLQWVEPTCDNTYKFSALACVKKHAS
ncbi:hypothetical protein JHK86_025232 [Glycine max]|nr:hypothetical protein JHK86_025232 [Glycine max]